MILYKIRLNESKYKKNSSVVRIHGIVNYRRNHEKEDTNRRLWRVDTINGYPYLLILCKYEEDWQYLKEKLCDSNVSIQSLRYDDFLNNIDTGKKYVFRISYNPTMPAINNDDGLKCKVRAITDEDGFKKRFTDIGAKNGFDVIVSDVKQRCRHSMKKQNGNTVTFVSALIEGVLRVTDKELFNRVLCAGIGREKAYGQGMLNISETA